MKLTTAKCKEALLDAQHDDILLEYADMSIEGKIKRVTKVKAGDKTVRVFSDDQDMKMAVVSADGDTKIHAVWFDPYWEFIPEDAAELKDPALSWKPPYDADDYVFMLDDLNGDGTGLPCVWIHPRNYWDKTGAMFDQSVFSAWLGDNQTYEDVFFETTESCYEWDADLRSVEDIRKILLGLGMTEVSLPGD